MDLAQILSLGNFFLSQMFVVLLVTSLMHDFDEKIFVIEGCAIPFG